MLPKTEISDARRRSLSRMAELLRTVLPALNELSVHQKVPSSVKTKQPTHSGDGTVGCTSSSSIAQVPMFSDRFKASDRSTKVLPTGGTVSARPARSQPLN
jgi:hypothetical protein